MIATPNFEIEWLNLTLEHGTVDLAGCACERCKGTGKVMVDVAWTGEPSRYEPVKCGACGGYGSDIEKAKNRLLTRGD